MKLLFSIGILFAGCCLSTATRAGDAAPDFARDVLPIFKEHCYECHGPKKQRNGYRLDRRSAAFGGLVRHNIRPGSSVSSRLYRRVLDSEFGPQMPIEDTLSEAEIATLKRWIDAGAQWPDELANEVDLPPPDAGAVALAALIRTLPTDKTARRRVLSAIRARPDIVNARGIGGTSPLMEVALYGDAALLRAFLDAGGNAKTANDRGATPLLWAVEDLAKVQLLLDRGADPNAASDFGQTPLMQAAGSKDSGPVLKLLLERGAEPSQPAMNLTAARANPESLRLLLARMPDKGDAALSALRVGCGECLRVLNVESGAKIPRALAFSLPVANSGNPDEVHRALQFQPDVNARDAKGRTPLMLASISETVPPDLVHTLIERGARVDDRSHEGLGALDYARRLGRPEFVDALTRAGATAARPAPAPTEVRPIRGNDPLAAIARSVPLLQRTGLAFYEKGGCLSCHHNLLGLKTTQLLRERGLPFDLDVEAREKTFIVEDTVLARDQSLQGIIIPGGLTTTTGYLLIALDGIGHRADAATDAMVRLMRRAQQRDGRWISPVRPPSEGSEFTATAVGLRGIQLYGSARNAADRDAVRLATNWLRRNPPRNTEDSVFKLLGLVWARAPARERKSLARALLGAQRPDGGWSQLPWRDSDAYATGQVLVALQAAGIRTDSPEYVRGMRYLLDSQLDDGSWLVHTRAVFTQHYFETGFPHGIDQFISAAATHWAVQALAVSLR